MAEKHGFEYYRHGTLSLYAALNPQTGEVICQTAARHTSQESVDFLEEVISNQPAGQEIHVILDNFATHKTDLVKCFLRRHPNVRLHFTPTYSSWLNQVESWFSKLQRDVIDRGILSPILNARSFVTSGSTRKQPNPFSGNTQMSEKHSGVVAMSRGQAT